MFLYLGQPIADDVISGLDLERAEDHDIASQTTGSVTVSYCPCWTLSAGPVRYTHVHDITLINGQKSSSGISDCMPLWKFPLGPLRNQWFVFGLF